MTSTNPPTQPDLRTAFDHSIWYTLSLWPALRTAVQQNWGGPQSSDKLDWFAGAVSDLLVTRAETDFEDLVVFLLQVMQDEFEVDVEDDSEEAVARGCLELRERVLGEGDLGGLREVEARWSGRGKGSGDVVVVDGEVEGDEDELDDEDEGDGDVQMEGAVQNGSSAVKEKPQPEVDEDGFTKVVGRKKR